MLNLYNLAHASSRWWTFTLPQILGNLQGVGDYKLSCRTEDFSGWLLCDGRAVARADYPLLFDAIGTAFGEPPDEDTFILPDGRGRVVGMLGQGHLLTTRVLGDVVGTESHTLTSAQMPAHTHTGTTDSQGSHSHGITDPGHSHSQTTVNDDFNNSGGSGPSFAADSAGSRTWTNINSSTTGITVNAAGAHTHGFTTSSVGCNAPLPLMQPTLFGANLFIYAGYNVVA